MTIKNKITYVGLGEVEIVAGLPIQTPFVSAHKVIYDLENESTGTEIREPKQQTVEACRYIGGVFCNMCDMWDETGMSWQMIYDPEPKWFCGPCSLSYCNKKEKENIEVVEKLKSIQTTVSLKKNKNSTETEKEFSFDVEMEEDISPSELISSLGPMTTIKSSKYFVSLDSDVENVKNLTDQPFINKNDRNKNKLKK